MKSEVRLCVHVAPYVACRKFYEDVLGFRVYKEWDRSSNDRGVVYDIDGTFLELLLSDTAHQTTFDGTFYLYIKVPDVRAHFEALKSKGLALAPPTAYPWGHTSFSVTDPAGMKLTFFTETEV